MEDLTGKKLGPYEIISPLGEGGMAMVYRGYQAGVNREVAIKVLPQYFARDAQFAARFRREAQLLAQLQHPHILPVFDYGDSDGHTYLAMPLIRSGTLADWLNGQPLPYAQCRKFITQIGDALDYAHARGLIHRDVKPSNVLIDERGNCLLTDFGLARMVEGGERVTTSGAIMGTPAYMSPEQCMGRPLDGRADVYSLGVILYEMAVGRAPYEADTPILIVVKHIHDPLPAPGAVVPGFPRGLEAVILKALAKKPEDRYQTAGALVEALNAALDEIERGGAPPPGKTDPARPPLTNPPGPDFTSGHPLRPGSGAGGRDADPQGPLGGAPRGPGGADPQGPVGERDAGTMEIRPPRPARPEAATIRLRRPGRLLPVLGAVVLAGAALTAVVLGAWLLNFSRTAGATEAPGPTAPGTQVVLNAPTATRAGAVVPTAALTPAPAATAGILLQENFESGAMPDWKTMIGQASVVEMPDGNHALRLIQNEFNGAQAVFVPSWAWEVPGYTFEADVMTEAVEALTTSLRLDFGVVDDEPERSCLNYFAELGSGWARLGTQTADGGHCSGAWQVVDLGTARDFELQPGAWHHLRLDVRGSDFRFYVDDILIDSAGDALATYASGGIGISVLHTPRGYVDNVDIRAQAGAVR